MDEKDNNVVQLRAVPEAVSPLPTSATMIRAIADDFEKGGIPASYSKAIVILLDDGLEKYHIKTISNDLTYSEIVSLCSAVQYTALNEVTGALTDHPSTLEN